MTTLTDGDRLTYTTGRWTVILQRVRSDAHTVVVEKGGFRVDDLCGSYPTEAEARAVARLHAQMALAETVEGN